MEAGIEHQMFRCCLNETVNGIYFTKYHVQN